MPSMSRRYTQGCWKSYSHSSRLEKIIHDVIECCPKGCPDIHLFCTQQRNYWYTEADFRRHPSLNWRGHNSISNPFIYNHHYYMVCIAVQPQQTNCPTYGISLKHVESRPCPNSEVESENTYTVLKHKIRTVDQPTTLSFRLRMLKRNTETGWKTFAKTLKTKSLWRYSKCKFLLGDWCVEESRQKT